MALHFLFMWFFALNGVAYVLYSIVSGERREMVPDRNSLWDAILVLLHDLGLRKQLPPQTKYNAAQKIAYTGTIAMAPDPNDIKPESYTLDAALLARPGNREIQLDLFLDYANNVKLYPSFQEYFRSAQPPLLAVWGQHDPFFLPIGAESFRRDNPNTTVQLLDAGHFALETHVEEITSAIKSFLQKQGL